MIDGELEALQNPDEWDFEHAERRSGVKQPRAVVSVAFSRDDFERVSGCAERLRKRTSEFIREAALERVSHYQGLAALAAFSASTSAVLFTRTPPPTTRFSGSASQIGQDAVTA